MDREALHERIRRLIFASPALSASFVRGEFRSIFRGRGLDFESLREYTADDDSRLIDWNVSVRYSRPFVRSYREDRSLSLFLLVDRSASMDEGSGDISKGDMALLAAALLGHAAVLRDMPVGGLHFAAEILEYREPRRGRSRALSFAEAGLGEGPASTEGSRRETDGNAQSGRNPPGQDAALGEKGSAQAGQGTVLAGQGTALATSLDTVFRLLKRRSLVIVISDFRATGWREPLGILARRHDVVAIRVTDALEREAPERGAFVSIDPEAPARGGGRGRAAWLPFASRSFRRNWVKFWKSDADRIGRAFAEAGIASLSLDTADDPALRLLEFFDRRRRRGT